MVTGDAEHPAPVPDGEFGYYAAIGEEARNLAVHKPFSDVDADTMLMQIGAVISLLPTPPSDVLECGCGTGWLSKLLTKIGYQMTGVDVAPEAIRLARSQAVFEGQPGPRFEVASGEDLPFRSEFDAVVYFDALHHVDDEAAAIRSAHRALRPGGVLITSEPGRGHHDASHHTVSTFGVTEKDMPARHIARLARDAGFASVKLHPRADELGRAIYTGYDGPSALRRWAGQTVGAKAALAVRRILWNRLDNGIVVCTKAA